MKIGILSIAFVLFLSTSFGQGKNNPGATGAIVGKVIDSASRLPLESATISLNATGKNRVLNRTTTDSSGNFGLTNILPGSYTVVIEYVGYRTINIRNIVVTQTRDIVNLKSIHAIPKTNVEQSVIVTAPPKLIDNKIDKLVFNAERDITSQTGVATDLLAKVPQVSVDVDGNVELQGSSNILFLIDGKPSTIFGSNITDVLQAIPASQIKSIEVITNPGAKYDANAAGGIINIILKHNTAQGVNGNLSLTAGTIIQNGSFNLNARKGKFGMNAFFDGNARLSTTTPSSSLRTSTDTIAKTTTLLQQNGSSDFTRHGLQTGIGFDWSITDNNSLSGGVSYHNFGNRANGYVDQLQRTQNVAGGPYTDTSSVNRISSGFTQYSIDPSLDFKRRFAKKDQELEIEMDGSFAHPSSNTGNDQYAMPHDSLIYGTRNNNPAKENEYEVKADYTQPLHDDVNLGVGGKFSGYDISTAANALVWNPYSGSYLYNAALSNNLDYHQRVYAGYAELNFPIGKSIDARLGGRYERTQITSFYANAHQTIDNGYNTWIPSVFVLKKIGETQTIKLNFTIRINRPDYGDLNPFINTSDPKNISTGNPSLKPEIWDRYEASYNKDLGKLGSFLVTMFYRQSNGDIQRFIQYYPTLQVGDTTYTNVNLTTRQNIGIEENLGTNLFFDLHANDKFNVRSNTTFFYRHTINQVDPGYNSSGTILRTNINASYQFAGGYTAEFFGNFSSHHHEAQGFYPSFISYSLAIRKQFWNKKGSLALTANNFFSKYVDQRTQLYGPGFVTNSVRSIPYQSVGINF
ncbi:MAG TPA: TonB-dependent receptor, partial [Puia sp.]|nr:TonB-dependent receptor [Puia sp.]